jgi:probable rRNA maturation factor
MIYSDIDVTLDNINITDSHYEIIKKVIEGIYNIEKLSFDAYVSVIITDKEEIRQINLDERGIDSPTDVLSFPYLEYDENYKLITPLNKEDYDPEYNAVCLGDMVICYDKILEQAEEYGHSEERELSYLVAHSMYHLLGYDHITDELKKDMREKEERALNEIF